MIKALCGSKGAGGRSSVHSADEWVRLPLNGQVVATAWAASELWSAPLCVLKLPDNASTQWVGPALGSAAIVASGCGSSDWSAQYTLHRSPGDRVLLVLADQDLQSCCPLCSFLRDRMQAHLCEALVHGQAGCSCLPGTSRLPEPGRLRTWPRDEEVRLGTCLASPRSHEPMRG